MDLYKLDIGCGRIIEVFQAESVPQAVHAAVLTAIYDPDIARRITVAKFVPAAIQPNGTVENRNLRPFFVWRSDGFQEASGGDYLPNLTGKPLCDILPFLESEMK